MSKYGENMKTQILDCITEPDSTFTINDTAKLLALMSEMDIQDYICNEIMQCSGADKTAYFELLNALKSIKQYKNASEPTTQTEQVDDSDEPESSNAPRTPKLPIFEDDDDEEIVETIVKRKDIDSKPMGEEEAILQMELLGHDFFLFKNVDEECTSLIYKRKDGNYGIINCR